jgi:hypothetical protein
MDATTSLPPDSSTSDQPGSPPSRIGGDPTRPPVTEVHVLGFTISKRDAPWDRWEEPGVELWGLNNLHIADDVPTERCHRWFDMHPADVIASDEHHVDWLRRESPRRPVYMFESAAREMSAAGVEPVVFPVQEVIDGTGSRYFTNSISWMLGLAMMELQPQLHACKRWDHVVTSGAMLGWGDDQTERALIAADLDPAVMPKAPVIGVWGVDMATDTEYGAQRPSCEFFVGMALGAGFVVQIAPTSDLLSSGELYGVEDNGKLRAKLMSRQTEYRERLAEATNARNAAVQEQVRRDAEINHLNGALSDAQYWLDRWTMPAIDRSAASKPGQLTS